MLDTHACPPRITGYTGAEIIWSAYRGRSYTLQGLTNEVFGSSLNWSNLVTTTAGGIAPWSYPALPAPADFHFLRIRQDSPPNWAE